MVHLEPGLCIQQLEVIGRSLMTPGGHDEHVQVRELGRVGLILRADDTLDHEELSTLVHRRPTRAQDLDRRIVPVVDDALEQVGIRPGGHCFEEASSYYLATICHTRPFEESSYGTYGVGLIEEDATQRRIRRQDRR